MKKASEYIAFMRQNNGRNSKDIEDLRRQNAHLENQVSGEIIFPKNDFLITDPSSGEGKELRKFFKYDHVSI